MIDRARLIRYYAVVLVAVVVLFTLLYDAGMTVFEGRPRGLVHSLEVVMQTFTTTGYGQDAPWQTAEMKLLVVVMQVSSTVLLFAALPVIVVPLMEEMLELTAPTNAGGLEDHVVVCSHGTDTAALVDELSARDVEYIVVESDRDTANDLHETGVEVVHADPESPTALARADAADSRAIVADVDDESNLSIIVAAEEIAPGVPTYSVAERPEFANYQRYAGADDVFSPRALLGKGLANKIRAAVVPDLDGGAAVGDDFDIGEFPVRPGSDLCGQRVGEAAIADRAGVSVIGAFSSGTFRRPPFPELTLDEHTVLLAAGREDQLERIQRLTDASRQTYERGEVLVVGTGVVGSTVRAVLEDSDVPLTTMDLDDGPDVDYVGDATDAADLREAGVEDASTVVLALDDDTTTLIATFVVREIDDEVEVVARANHQDNVGKLYRAGADYVLALSTVSGRLLAADILDDEAVLTIDRRVRVVDRPADSFAGQRLSDLEIPERTGCTVVAIEHRDGRVSVTPAEWTELSATDRLVVTGMEPDIERFDALEDGNA